MFVALWSTAATPHGGGLDASGCHHDRQRGGYHCHRGNPAPPPRRVARPPAPPARAPVRIAPPVTPVQPETPQLLAVQPVTPAQPAGNQREPIVGQAVALDGDTLQIGLVRVRLYGVDAFEAEQRCGPNPNEATRCGAAASHAMARLVATGETICAPRDVDAYGRLVAVCRVGATDLGATLVREGLALAFRRYALDYVPDENAARLARVGAWAAGFVAPEDYRAGGNSGTATAQRVTAVDQSRCTIRGNINREGERIYHMPSDPYYNRTNPEALFCTEAEAEAAGFRRAGRPR